MPTDNTVLVANAVHRYLRDEQGYQDSAYKLNVEFHQEAALFGQDIYAIKVTFRDEPDATYYYHYGNNQIHQKGVAPMNGKMDKTFKHVETK